MEINQLKYFKSVADSGKITSAAKELFISAAAISASLAALEKELNVELFQRTGNSLKLNRQGKIFLDYANYILDSVADAKKDLLFSLTDRKKSIIVGVTSAGLFTDLFSDFSAKHADISLTTATIPLRYINSAGLNSRFSFLFATDTETPAAYAKACESCILYEDQPAVMVSPDHPFAKKDCISPEELSNIPLIWPKTNLGMMDGFLKEFSARLLPPPVFLNQDVQVAYSFVKKGLGIALMTTHSQNILTNDMVFVPIDLPSCRWKQMLYWKKDHELSNEDFLFLKYIKEYYSLS